MDDKPARAYNTTQAPNNTPPAVVASAASKGVEICKGRTFPTAAFLKKTNCKISTFAHVSLDLIHTWIQSH